MPTLIRFLTVIAVIVGLIYAGIFALATFFDPEPREITVTIPPDKFQKR
jgi:phage shock protein PspC (stress-responsive transcriptional regulator)